MMNQLMLESLVEIRRYAFLGFFGGYREWLLKSLHCTCIKVVVEVIKNLQFIGMI